MCDSWPVTGSSTSTPPSTRDRARTNSSRSSLRRRPGREPAWLEPRQRIPQALQRAHCRLDEELAPDERGDGIPREAEDERVAADAERDRLAGLDCHSPEHLLDAELSLRRPDEVVLADRDTARGDEDVGRESTLDGFPQRLLVVRDGRLGLHLGARGDQRGGEHETVRLVDLARPQLPAGTDELAARREHGNPRAACARQLSDAGGRSRGQACGREPHAGGDHHLSGSDVATARANVRAGSDRLRYLHRVVALDNVFDRDDGVGALRHDRARRDGHRTARFDLRRERLPRGGLAGDP